MRSLLERRIDRECRDTQPGTTARMKALARVRWVLATDDGRFVKVDETARVSLTNEARDAAVYDARDNERSKCRFMEAVLKERLSVIILEA